MKKFLKKILALAIILWMFGQVSINSFADYNYELSYVKEDILILKKELQNIKWWEKIISKIDAFVEKIDDNKAKTLEAKIKIIKDKLTYRNDIISEKEEKILLIINYINNKLKLRKLLKAEQVKKDAFKNTLSESDIKKVNTELVKIQNNLLNTWVSYYENLLWELEKYTNFEEKGNFNASVKVDMWEKYKWDFSLKLKDYVSKNSGFDTQFKTRIEAVLNATENWKEIKAEISALVDYIMKDQNYYVLLKDLKIVNDNDVLKMESYVSKIKEIAAKNKYIHFEDKNAANLVNILKQLNPSNILNQGKTIASKPLFTAYKKVWTKYYLVPSKYGCDTAKTLAKKFDPFNWSNCTESQYQNLLSDIADTKAEFYIDFSGRNTIIWFEADSIDNDVEKFNGFISFSDKYIEEVKAIIVPKQEKYKWEWAELHFVRAKKLDAKVLVKDLQIDFNLKSTLDGANRFKTIDFKFNKEDDFSSELTLKNRKITGNYNAELYNSKIVWTITWKTDTSNKISTFKLDNKHTISSGYNPGEVNTTLEYSYWKYSFKNIATFEWNKSDILISATVKNKKLTAWEINIDVQSKEWKFDYDSYKMIYSWDFKKLVDWKIELKNKNITWKTSVFKDNKEYLVITNKGRLEEDKLELNNKIEFAESLMKYIAPINWDIKEKVELNPEANFNIKTDATSNKNNANIYFDYKESSKKIIEVELDNKSRKTYKKVKIMAPMPNDTIEADEVFSNTKMY